jgi:two-component sensor histidine kinase
MTNPDKHSNGQQEYLKDIITNTLSSDDLGAAIKNIAAELGKLFDADRVHFRFYDESLNTFSEVIEEYRKDETILSAKGKMIYPHDFDTYLKDKLAEKNHLFVIDDINKHEYPETFRELFKNLNIKNEIILPIFYRNKLESVFFITNTLSSELLSAKNLDFLIPIARQLSIGTHLFKLNETLNKTLYCEKILREAVFNVRLYKQPEAVFEYMANSLADLYKVNRVVHLHVDSFGDYIVLYEALRDMNEELNGKIMFKAESFKELIGYIENSIIIIDDIRQIKNIELQNYLKKNDIKAFMLYPIEELFPIKGERKIEERIMVCSKIPKKWSHQNIESLKLIIGTLTVIYVDIRSRKEIREIEETFTASLVHDLKSPLYSEQKALEFIMSRKPETTIQSITSYLSDMYKTNEELLRLITNLLTVYSLELGQHELKKEASNIIKIIDNANRSVKYLADDNEAKIVKNIQENLEDLYIDPDEIMRVFINLIGNAIKHNPKGIEVNISAEKKEDEILVSVSDNGIGISESERANIFQKLKTTKRKVSTGLGLYLSKQIVEFHGGRIWFQSEEGKGTTFYFTLPLTSQI